jgi:hypothetical protein
VFAAEAALLAIRAVLLILELNVAISPTISLI